MIKNINGQSFYSLLDYGIRNLSLYKEHINALNVFPVPDGDTGTNMVMTLQSGFSVIGEDTEELGSVAKAFSGTIVFGARGNSGVIASQFFKGICDVFAGCSCADAETLVSAIENGVGCAYISVSKPVEGTMLTVVREGAEYLRSQLTKGNILTVDDAIASFLKQARRTLDNTPDMLPVLKSAGVVDSGGAGIVYFFEGMQKYLRGEPLAETAASISMGKAVDYSAFNRSSSFDFGYCTEFVLQLTDRKCDFDYDTFREDLYDMGDSIVTVFDNDRVKVHIHTKSPEQVLGYSHSYGEFLSLKIENMNVQHNEYKQTATVKLHGGDDARVAAVAVAHSPAMEAMFGEMGADIVICGYGEYPPSAQDFIEEYKKLSVPNIVVFPNSNDTDLAAKQSCKLYSGANVVVISTSTDAECYSALPMVDFGAEDVDAMAEELRETVENVTAVMVAQAQRDAQFDGKTLQAGDYFAIIGKRLLAEGKTVDEVAALAIEGVMSEEGKDILTVFKGKYTPDTVDGVINELMENKYPLTETEIITTDNALYNLVLSFE